MGCDESKVSEEDSPAVTERDTQLGGMPNNFTKKQFQAQRNGNSIEDALAQISKVATNLKGASPSSIKPADKLCFICCNTYTKAQYQLGVGPLNDSVTVAMNHKKRGYQVFFLHNPTPQEFLTFLPLFMKQTKTALTVFFTGHGANVKDKNGDESDGFDEAMVFDTGHIVDDDLVKIICENCNGVVKVLLLTDCCHSGSIWDLQSADDHGLKLPQNVISISAAKDSQTAKQTKMNNKDQGIFSYFFWKLLNAEPKLTPKDLETKMNASLNKFKQHYTAFATSSNMMNQPLFA